MKALVYTAPKELQLQEFPIPSVEAGEVRIRVRSAGICGSDLHGYLGKSKKRVPPLVLGHELVGDVDVVGGQVTDLQSGERVTVNPLLTCGECEQCRSGQENICPNRILLGMTRHGAYMEFITVPRSAVYTLRPTTADNDAVLIEPLANAVHIISNYMNKQGDTVAVFGAGTVGMTVMKVAQLLGAGKTIIVDINDDRLEVATALGANVAINSSQHDVVQAIREATGGSGVALAVDAVGLGVTRKQAMQSVKQGGNVVFVGLVESVSEIDCLEIIARELHVSGAYAYTHNDFRRAVEFVENGLTFEPYIETLPLERGEEGFIRLMNNPGKVVKFALVP
jgi:threonine dehydrogenase-like Zn-dependent dehydrogenase